MRRTFDRRAPYPLGVIPFEGRLCGVIKPCGAGVGVDALARLLSRTMAESKFVPAPLVSIGGSLRKMRTAEPRKGANFGRDGGVLTQRLGGRRGTACGTAAPRSAGDATAAAAATLAPPALLPGKRG